MQKEKYRRRKAAGEAYGRGRATGLVVIRELLKGPVA
jgi:hypothetical protein